VAIDIFGDPTSPGWEEQNLVTIRAPNGQTWRVHRLAAPAFQGLLGDLAAAGYDAQSSGGFNYRPIRGGTRLSQHAFGNAIDINAAANPMLKGVLQTNLPANTAELAAKYGLTWGGTWKNRPDPMHFEWRGPDGAGIQTPHAHGAAPTGAGLSFGPGVAAAPTDMAGIAGMFGGGGLSMGAPADPFAVSGQKTALAKQEKREAEEAAQIKRQALLSGVGAMFG
jgi:hypothetical protein